MALLVAASHSSHLQMDKPSQTIVFAVHAIRIMHKRMQSTCSLQGTSDSQLLQETVEVVLSLTA